MMDTSFTSIFMAVCVLCFAALTVFKSNSYNADEQTLLHMEKSNLLVNVSQLLHNISDEYKSLVQKQGLAYAGLPYLKNSNYLSTLSVYASQTKVQRILVVTGPRGSGKSEGILAMIPAWERLNYFVFDYNEDHIGNLKSALGKRVVNYLTSMDYEVLECFHDKSVSESGGKFTFDIHAGKLFQIQIPVTQGWIVSTIAVLSIVILVLRPEWLGKVYVFLKGIDWIKVLRVFISIVIVGIILQPNTQWIWTRAHEQFIEKFGLYGLISTCSIIRKCDPFHLPILIIRHYSTEPESMNNMFHLLKRGIGSFPIIVEAPDYNWKNSPAVTKSRELFLDFKLQEMTFEEGKAQLVDKYNIWPDDEYAKIYETLGGHMGSLGQLFDYNKILSISLNDALSHMEEQAYSRFVHTLSQLNDTNMALLVLNTMLTDGTVDLIKLGGNLSKFLQDAQILSNENHVYIESAGGKMYAHSQLMKRGMQKTLDNFIEPRNSSAENK